MSSSIARLLARLGVLAVAAPVQAAAAPVRAAAPPNVRYPVAEGEWLPVGPSQESIERKAATAPSAGAGAGAENASRQPASGQKTADGKPGLAGASPARKPLKPLNQRPSAAGAQEMGLWQEDASAADR